MTTKEKYNRLDDEFKIARISGVLRNIPLTAAELEKLKRQVQKYGQYFYMDMPAVDVKSISL